MHKLFFLILEFEILSTLIWNATIFLKGLFFVKLQAAFNVKTKSQTWHKFVNNFSSYNKTAGLFLITWCIYAIQFKVNNFNI